MDLPTILARVDAKHYAAPEAFLADIASIVQVLPASEHAHCLALFLMRRCHALPIDIVLRPICKALCTACS